MSKETASVGHRSLIANKIVDPPFERNPLMCRCAVNVPKVKCPLRSDIRKIGTIQRRLAWPLHKDDTLFQSGRPSGLNIYCSVFVSRFLTRCYPLNLFVRIRIHSSRFLDAHVEQKNL